MVKKSFSIGLTETQRELIDYAIDERYHGHNVSITQYVWKLIQQDLFDILGITLELDLGFNPSDAALLKMFEEETKQNTYRTIERIGIERYKKLIYNAKELNPLVTETMDQYEKDLLEGKIVEDEEQLKKFDKLIKEESE